MGAEGEIYCTELATIDGITYVSVPDGVALPEQPKQLEITPVALTDGLREAIRAASPHCRLIDERTEAKIRARYSVSDELRFARIGNAATLVKAPDGKTGETDKVRAMKSGELSQIEAYNAHVEACVEWGRVEREKLGL